MIEDDNQSVALPQGPVQSLFSRVFNPPLAPLDLPLPMFAMAAAL